MTLPPRDDQRRIRVLINAVHSKTGGGVTYLHNIVPWLARDPRLELHIVLHEHQLDRYADLADHARLHPFRFSDRMLNTLVWEQSVLPAVKRSLEADVLYSPANYGPLLAGNTVILMRNSLAVASKDMRPGKMLYWFGVALMTLFSLIAARRIVAVSNYTVSYLRRWPLKWLQRKLTIINHGVAPLFHVSGQPRENFLLAVGDLYIQKNFLRLVEAFARLGHTHPDLTLQIAGQPVDAQYAADLRAAIAAHGLQDKVILLGHTPRERLAELYGRCALFVFPSTVETFGNPLVEALASGAPVACSNAAAMPEIAGDAVAYFDPENVDSMVGVIDGLLRDEAMRHELSRRAAARGAMFSWERCAAELAACLKQAAS